MNTKFYLNTRTEYDKLAFQKNFLSQLPNMNGRNSNREIKCNESNGMRNKIINSLKKTNTQINTCSNIKTNFNINSDKNCQTTSFDPKLESNILYSIYTDESAKLNNKITNFTIELEPQNFNLKKINLINNTIPSRSTIKDKKKVNANNKEENFILNPCNNNINSRQSLNFLKSQRTTYNYTDNLNFNSIDSEENDFIKYPKILNFTNYINPNANFNSNANGNKSANQNCNYQYTRSSPIDDKNIKNSVLLFSSFKNLNSYLKIKECKYLDHQKTTDTYTDTNSLKQLTQSKTIELNKEGASSSRFFAYRNRNENVEKIVKEYVDNKIPDTFSSINNFKRKIIVILDGSIFISKYSIKGYIFEIPTVEFLLDPINKNKKRRMEIYFNFLKHCREKFSNKKLFKTLFLINGTPIFDLAEIPLGVKCLFVSNGPFFKGVKILNINLNIKTSSKIEKPLKNIQENTKYQNIRFNNLINFSSTITTLKHYKNKIPVNKITENFINEKKEKTLRSFESLGKDLPFVLNEISNLSRMDLYQLFIQYKTLLRLSESIKICSDLVTRTLDLNNILSTFAENPLQILENEILDIMTSKQELGVSFKDFLNHISEMNQDDVSNKLDVLLGIIDTNKNKKLSYDEINNLCKSSLSENLISNYSSEIIFQLSNYFVLIIYKLSGLENFKQPIAMDLIRRILKIEEGKKTDYIEMLSYLESYEFKQSICFD